MEYINFPKSLKKHNYKHNESVQWVDQFTCSVWSCLTSQRKSVVQFSHKNNNNNKKKNSKGGFINVFNVAE